jgi:aspartate/methionine/tyrosine aminotransferase
LREAIARFAVDVPQAHLYGPVLGLGDLREQVAADWSDAYGGSVDALDVAIPSGCNQAFAAAISTLAGTGDEVLLPKPWYFNHKMWLDMAGIQSVPMPCGAGMLPDPEVAAGLITDKTRAIVLVTPNNPTGAEYPASLVRVFFELCRARVCFDCGRDVPRFSFQQRRAA